MTPRRLATIVLLAGSLAGADTKVNTARYSDWPSVLAVSNGEWLVLHDDRASGGGADWSVSRFDRFGNRTFGPSPAWHPVGTVPIQRNIAWSGSKVGWAYDTPAPGGSNVLFNLLNLDGSQAAPEVLLSASSPTTYYPCCPDVEWAEGEFNAIWKSDGSGGRDRALRAMRLDGDGQTLTGELVVYDQPTVMDQVFLQQITRVGDSLCAFFAHRQGANMDLMATWLDKSGAVIVPPTSYVSVANGANDLEALGGADRAILAYSAYDTSSSQWMYTLQVSTSGAVVEGPDFVDDPSMAYPWQHIVRGGAHGLGIAIENVEPGDTRQIWLRRVTTDGSIGSKPFAVSDVPLTAAANAPSMAHRRGSYAAGWRDGREGDPGYTDVYFDLAPTYGLLAIAPGPSPSAVPIVTLHQPEAPAVPAVTFQPYGASGYGADVGAGDVNGAVADEVLTGPGPSAVYGPQVRAFGWQGAALPKVNFYAYGTLRYGAKVEGALLDGDGFHEVLTTPGPGAVFGPHVRGFDFDNVQLRAMPKVSFYAYATLKYGANAASGDVEGDGFGEVLAGPGPGAIFGTHLRGFDYDGVAVTAIAKVNTMVFPGGTHGLHVAAGDVEWDGIDEIGAAPGPGPASETRIVVYDFDGAALSEKAGSRFEAFAGSLGGAHLALAVADNDFPLEVLASRGPLPSSSSAVAVFDDAAAGFAPLQSFDPSPGGTHGTTLGCVLPGF